MTDDATPRSEPTDPADVQPLEVDAAAASPNGATPHEPSVVTPLTPPPPGLAQERPELLVGAAFAGGFVLALLLKRLAR